MYMMMSYGVGTCMQKGSTTCTQHPHAFKSITACECKVVNGARVIVVAYPGSSFRRHACPHRPGTTSHVQLDGNRSWTQAFKICMWVHVASLWISIGQLATLGFVMGDRSMFLRFSTVQMPKLIVRALAQTLLRPQPPCWRCVRFLKLDDPFGQFVLQCVS